MLAPSGNFYALEASRHLGLGDAGGLRMGLAPYTDATTSSACSTGSPRRSADARRAIGRSRPCGSVGAAVGGPP